MKQLETLDEAIRANAIRRLDRIEGQVRGLKRMIEDGRYCVEILTQVAAAQEALRGVGKVIMHNYLRNCVTDAIKGGAGDDIYEELMEVIYKYVR